MLARGKVGVLGISEIGWPGTGFIIGNQKNLLYSGEKQNKSRNDAKKISTHLPGHWATSDRVFIVKLKGKSVNLNVIHVYASTSDSPEDQKSFYKQPGEAKEHYKNLENEIVIGDLNAKMGKYGEGNEIGRFGLRIRNERQKMGGIVQTDKKKEKKM